MKVSFEHREIMTSKGAFSRQTIRQVELRTTVQFTETERAVILGWGLASSRLIERLFDRHTYDKSDGVKEKDYVAVIDFLEGEPDVFIFDRPGLAKLYQAELTEKLTALKSVIDQNTALAEPTTFEI